MKHVLRKNSETIIGVFTTNLAIAYSVLWLMANGHGLKEVIELSLFISVIMTLVTVSYCTYNSRYKSLVKLIFTLIGK